mmetsp:Transcript_32925/g.83101  ORF Transcript_32925/g.83101 Transcript_32925/m.83101 type:complete len:314 (-) Transcript_32925:150-1091(-)
MCSTTAMTPSIAPRAVDTPSLSLSLSLVLDVCRWCVSHKMPCGSRGRPVAVGSHCPARCCRAISGAPSASDSSACTTKWPIRCGASGSSSRHSATPGGRSSAARRWSVPLAMPQTRRRRSPAAAHSPGGGSYTNRASAPATAAAAAASGSSAVQTATCAPGAAAASRAAMSRPQSTFMGPPHTTAARAPRSTSAPEPPVWPPARNTGLGAAWPCEAAWKLWAHATMARPAARMSSGAASSPTRMKGASSAPNASPGSTLKPWPSSSASANASPPGAPLALHTSTSTNMPACGTMGRTSALPPRPASSAASRAA